MNPTIKFKYSLLTITLFLVIGYSIYYDLTSGTLPKNEGTVSIEKEYEKSDDNDSTSEIMNTQPAQEVIVDNGYTVLSIVEHLHNGPVPASIQQIIYDFQELNPGVSADQIQVGKTYLFPLYQQNQQ